MLRLIDTFLTLGLLQIGIYNPWNSEITTTQLQNEYTEIYNLGVHLLSTYSNKTFILNNWEGDWALLGDFTPIAIVPPYRAERMAAFLSARQRAIKDARKNVSSTSTLLGSVEVNRTLDPYGQRVHRDVLTLMKPDMVSFSLYECINTWGTQAETINNIDYLMRKAIRNVKQNVGNSMPLYVGEYGWPEAEAGFIFNNLTASRTYTESSRCCNGTRIN
jgi:hypothetical protein